MHNHSCYLPAEYQRLSSHFPHLVPSHGLDFGATRDRCTCGDPKCSRPGKHPRVRWSEGLDAGDLAAWARRWRDWRPFVNWSAHLGRCGLVALDVDPRHGGLATLTGLLERLGPLPATTRDESGGGGSHHYYRAPDWFTAPRSQAVLGPGVELLGGNHLCHLPPSVHHCGREYRWRAAPWDVGFSENLGWLETFLRKEQSDWEARQPRPLSPAELRYLARAREGRRSRGIDQARRYLGRVPGAVAGRGGWADTSALVVKLTGRFDLDEAEAWELLREWNRVCTPPWPEPQLLDKLRWARERVRPGSFAHRDSRRPGREPERPKSESAVEESESTVAETETADPHPADDFRDFDSAAFGDQLRDSLADSRRHEQEVRAKAGALKDEWVAADLARLRHEEYPCRSPRTVELAGYDRRSDREQLHLAYLRCDCWACPGCAGLHREEWKANFRLRLLGDGAGPSAWSATIDPARQVAVTARVRRQGGHYFYLKLNDGRRLIVADVAFAGGDESTAAEACDRLCRAVDAWAGERKPGGASRGWGIPRPPAGDGGLSYVGTALGDVRVEDAVAEAGDDSADLMPREVPVPKRQKYYARRWVVIDLPKRWGLAERKAYAARLRCSVLPRFVRSSYPVEEDTDRASRTVSNYADIPE